MKYPPFFNSIFGLFRSGRKSNALPDISSLQIEGKTLWLFPGDSLTGYLLTNDTSTGNDLADRKSPSGKFGNLLNAHGGAITYGASGKLAGVSDPARRHIVLNFALVAEQISTPPDPSSIAAQRDSIAAYLDPKANAIMPLLVCTNDLFQNKDVPTIKAALIEYWTWMANRGVKVIARTIPDGNPTLQGAPCSQANFDARRAELNTWILSDATSNGAYGTNDLDGFLKNYTGKTFYRDRLGIYDSDQTHFTEFGNELQARSLYNDVSGLGLLD